MTSERLGEIKTRNPKVNPSTRAFIKSLAPEHQDFFEMDGIDIIRNIIRDTAGVAKGKTHIPGISFLRQKKNQITVFTLSPAVQISLRDRARLCARALHLFYDQSVVDNPGASATAYIGGFLTILSAYASYHAFATKGLYKSFEEAHIEVVVKTFHSMEELKLATKKSVDFVAQKMLIDNPEDDYMPLIVAATTILILMGKNITEQNRDEWFKNRWRALGHVIGNKTPMDGCNPPLLEACRHLYMAMASRACVRRECFLIIRSLASLDSDINSDTFRTILRHLQWAEMSHIWLIFHYIFELNPDVLNFPQLCGPEVSALQKALTFLKTIPSEDIPYLKFLMNQHDLDVLESKRFIYYTAAAHSILEMSQPSMKNIQGRYTSDIRGFQSKVKDYVTKRNKISKFLSGSAYASSSRQGAIKMMEALMRDAVDSDQTEKTEEEVPEQRT